jgi:hypothetical protein
MANIINYVKIGKYEVRDSTGLSMNPYHHHFIQFKNPILVGPKHIALAFSTIARRSNRTGAIVSNEIRFVKLAKLKKDGSISKIQKFEEFNFSSGKIDKEGFQHFHDTFKLSEEYQAYHDMQVSIGKDMYSEYKFSMPEFHLNEIAMEVYLKLRNKGIYDQEEARLAARNRILEVRTAFLGNDPIIGLSELSPKQQDVSHELISYQLGKVNRIKHRILHEHPMNIDFTDHYELREESEKLARLRRGFIK